MKYLHITFLFSLLLSISCSSDKKEKYVIDKEFKTYISGFTSGEVSKKSDILIELASPANPEVIGEPIDLDVFEFSPSVKGKTIWLDACLLYTSPSPRDGATSRMPSSA